MSTAVGRRTLPAKTPLRKLDIVVPMLASGDERNRELASKRVACASVEADTDRVVWWFDVWPMSLLALSLRLMTAKKFLLLAAQTWVSVRWREHRPVALVGLRSAHEEEEEEEELRKG